MFKRLMIYIAIALCFIGDAFSVPQVIEDEKKLIVNSTSIGIRLDKLLISNVTLSLEQRIFDQHLLSLSYERIIPQTHPMHDGFRYGGLGMGHSYKYVLKSNKGLYLGIALRFIDKFYRNEPILIGYAGSGSIWSDFHTEMKSKRVTKYSGYIQGGYIFRYKFMQLDCFTGVGLTKINVVDQLIRYQQTPPPHWDGRKPGIIIREYKYPAIKIGIIFSLGWEYDHRKITPYDKEK